MALLKPVGLQITGEKAKHPRLFALPCAASLRHGRRSYGGLRRLRAGRNGFTRIRRWFGRIRSSEAATHSRTG